MRKLLLFFLFIPFIVKSQTVSNVNSTQVGNKIEVSYNINGAEKHRLMSINLYYSIGNESYKGPLQKVSGDVGLNISGNGSKKILWDVLSEISSLEGDVRFKIEATPLKEMNKPKSTSNYGEAIVESCILEGNLLTITFVCVPNSDGDWSFCTSYAYCFDEQGVKYYANSFSWSGKTSTASAPAFGASVDLIAGTPFKISFTFDDVSSVVKNLTAVQMKDFQYKNVPVVKQ